jgi:hypothetical protein
VSNNESFIDEVTEEVRREKLYGLLRRYGWIGIAAVVLIVGGAAWFEWQRAQAAAEAEARGDAMLEAVAAENPVAALEAIAASGTAEPVRLMLIAAEQEAAGDVAAAQATLEAVAALAEIDALYRDLARLKLLMMATDLDPGQRMAGLEGLSLPGAAFRLVALEQIAMLQVDAGDVDAARTTLAAILEDAGLTPGMAARAEALVEALGPVPATAPTDPVAE